jgi:hypothetical protein
VVVPEPDVPVLLVDPVPVAVPVVPAVPLLLVPDVVPLEELFAPLEVDPVEPEPVAPEVPAPLPTIGE